MCACGGCVGGCIDAKCRTLASCHKGLDILHRRGGIGLKNVSTVCGGRDECTFVASPPPHPALAQSRTCLDKDLHRVWHDSQQRMPSSNRDYGEVPRGFIMFFALLLRCGWSGWSVLQCMQHELHAGVLHTQAPWHQDMKPAQGIDRRRALPHLTRTPKRSPLCIHFIVT